MNWTSYKPLEYRGKTFGQKDLEFKRFLELPQQIGSSILEVALSGTRHTNWETDGGEFTDDIADYVHDHPKYTVRELLRYAGWRAVDAYHVCSNLDAYRQYIASSKAEWSVAKNGYVVGQPGWFSCRSACYLAAGKPVVVQDTGFSTILPVGEGILAFTTVQEAAAAIQAVEQDYARHAKAARTIAEEYFDSDRVLTRLIEEATTGGVAEAASR